MNEWVEEYLPVIAMVLLEFIYATLNIWNRQALIQGLPPSISVFYGQICATLFTFPVAYFSSDKSSNARMQFRAFFLIFITTFIGGTLYGNLSSEGLYLTSSSVTSAMYNLIPAITFLMAATLGWEQLSVKKLSSLAKITGTILCAAGACFMTLVTGPKLLITNFQNHNWLLGCLLLLASICCCCLTLILQVPVLNYYPDHLWLSAWICLIAMLQSGMVALFLEHDLKAWTLNSWVEVGSCLFSGIVGSGITTIIRIYGIARRGPLFTAAFTPLSTVITTLFACIFFNEGFYIGSFLGAIGVIAGLYAILWGKAEEMKPKIELGPRSSGESKIMGESSSNGINTEEPLLVDA